MMAMRFDFIADKRGNFSLAACMLAVPVLMGLALSVDYGRIEHARTTAISALRTAVSISGDRNGGIDIGLVRERYGSILKLPGGQSSTPPVLYLDAEGKRMVAVRTATRLTLGGVLLPKTYYSVVQVPAESGAAQDEQAQPPSG